MERRLSSRAEYIDGWLNRKAAAGSMHRRGARWHGSREIPAGGFYITNAFRFHRWGRMPRLMKSAPVLTPGWVNAWERTSESEPQTQE
jgi:hypothetical protein